MPAHQPCAQALEYLALIHGVYVGHGGQQKQEQFGEFQQVVAKSGFGDIANAALGVFPGDQAPDYSGCQNNRL